MEQLKEVPRSWVNRNKLDCNKVMMPWFCKHMINLMKRTEALLHFLRVHSRTGFVRRLSYRRRPEIGPPWLPKSKLHEKPIRKTTKNKLGGIGPIYGANNSFAAKWKLQKLEESGNARNLTKPSPTTNALCPIWLHSYEFWRVCLNWDMGHGIEVSFDSRPKGQ